MRKSNTQPLSEVLKEYIKSLDFEKKLLEVRLIDSWPHVVGMAIAKKTSKLVVKNKVLFVYLESSIVRNELLMIRESLVKALNERVGESIINEIVIR